MSYPFDPLWHFGVLLGTRKCNFEQCTSLSILNRETCIITTSTRCGLIKKINSKNAQDEIEFTIIRLKINALCELISLYFENTRMAKFQTDENLLQKPYALDLCASRIFSLR